MPDDHNTCARHSFTLEPRVLPGTGRSSSWQGEAPSDAGESAGGLR
jgi:hypothetical protein